MAKVAFQGKRELRWLQEGACFVTFFEADVEFADALWDKWLAALSAAPGRQAMLCTIGDIQPSKEQWRKATRIMRDSGKKIAVVTDSRPTSALVKAASWAGVEAKAFRWEALFDASEYIALEREQRIAMRATVTALRDYFGAKNTDGEIAAATGRPAFYSPSPAPAPQPEPTPARAIPLERPSFERPISEASALASARANNRTPMADAASRNLEHVRQTSEEIQAKLAEIQERLRNSRMRTRAS